MKRLFAALLAVLVVAGAVPAAATLGSTATATESNESAPGAAFAGVVGVQEAEVGNEVAQRALDQRLAKTDSNASKAAVVANETERIEQRLAELKERREAIETAYENGSITKAQRDAQLAAIAAQVRALERRANQTADVAADLPEQVLRNHGVNVTEVRSLAHQANELGGGAVAAAAKRVAGERVGDGLGKAADRGKNASDRGAKGNSDRGKNATERGRSGDGRSAGSDRGANRTDSGNRTAGDSAGNESATTPTGNESADAPAGNETATGSDTSDGGSTGDGSTDGSDTAGSGTGGTDQSGTDNATRTETRG